ncbi:MAG: flagellin lysine-N-methylase [Terracidiphilus sp.]
MPAPPSPLQITTAENFRCIGSACEDTCCQGWSVPIDKASFERYQSLPLSPLRTAIDSSVLAMPEPAQPAIFAKIQMNGSNQCPLLTEERLCGIQAQIGEQFLSQACATYPRIHQSIAGVTETALTLSCPEAARQILLNPNLSAWMQRSVAEERNRRFPDAPLADVTPSLLHWFRPIRLAILKLIGNRTYPLWQRLFLLGVLCRRLDSIANGELARAVPRFLTDFEATVASGALLPAMEALPVNLTAQLDVVLRLAGMLLHRSNVRPRFVECVQAFTAGIGNAPGATLEGLAERYAEAHDTHFGPFFDRHPYILENYLINTIVRCRFPFGPEQAPAGEPNTMAHEFALLTAQFALTKGFLIGVAGFRREAFSATEVVHTVQATSKHFEHHPEFLRMAYELLVESRMDGAWGLAILLRNAGPGSDPRAVRPASPAIQAPAPQDGTVASGHRPLEPLDPHLPVHGQSIEA